MKDSLMEIANKRVLCYSPYNLWPLHGTWEITILHALKLRGVQLRYVLCDGLYTECDVYRAAANPRHALSCSECQSEVTSLMLKLKVQRYEWLSRYLPLKSFDIARRWVSELSIHELENAKYSQWHIGEWVKSSVHTHLRISQIDIAVPMIERVFRNYLYSGLVASLGLSRLMDDYMPDALFLFNGRMSSTRIALELAKQRGVHVVCHERGFRRDSIRLTENDSVSALQPYERLHENWEEIPLIKGELQKISKYMIGKQYGKDTGWAALSPPPKTNEKLQFGATPNRIVWALFVSSEDEPAGHHFKGGGAFVNQMDWINKTVAYVKRHPEIDMVIRVHPNIAGKKAAGQSLSQLMRFKDLRRSLPDNVYMIFPDDPVSSYSLMDTATVGFVYYSSVGLEMACKGKKVIAASHSSMLHSSFVQIITASDNYLAILDEVLNIPLRNVFPEIQRSAYRYAYALFFRYNISFSLVRMLDKTHGIPTYKSLDELLPGRSNSLDKVTRIILKLDKAVPIPSDEEQLRTDVDEIAWFYSDQKDASSRSTTIEIPNIEPKISIVIPTYNYGHFIGQCLQSVLNQTYRNYEVIIMDDNSVDDTKDIISGFLGDKRVRYIKNALNLNQPRNCNKGSLIAKGEFIYFLHADDIFFPKNLERKLEVLNDNADIAAVFSGAYLISESGKIVQELKHEGRPNFNYFGDRNDYHDLLKYNYIPTPSDVLLRRKCLLKVGGFNEKLINGCDWELWLRIAKSFKLGFINEPLIGYRIHGKNLHTNLRRKNDVVVKDHFWILDNHLNGFEKDKNIEKIRGKAYMQIERTIDEIPDSYSKLYKEALKIRMKPSIMNFAEYDCSSGIDMNTGLMYAEEFIKNEEYINAIKLYVKLLKMRAKNSTVLNYSLGKIWMKLLKFDEATTCFVKLLNNNASYPRAYRDLGESYRQMNMYHQSEKAYKMGIELLPQDCSLRMGIAELYLEQWKLDSAIIELKTYLKLNPEDSHASALIEECINSTHYTKYR